MLGNIFSTAELATLKKNAFPIPTDHQTWEKIQQDGVVIFGAGLYGKIILETLLKNRVTPAWLIDNNPKLQGTKLGDIEVRPASSLADIGNRFLLLTGGYVRSMWQESLQYGIQKILLPRSLPEVVITGSAMGSSLDELEKNVSGIEKAYSLFVDEESKQTYKNLLAHDVTFDISYFQGCGPEGMYFPKGVPIDYSHFVDAGAFDGDTFLDWCKHTAFLSNPSAHAYYAFEPGPQFSLLKEKVNVLDDEQRKQIQLYNKALGEEVGRIDLTGKLCLDEVDINYEVVNTVFETTTIDTIFTEANPTIIKADIEGYELDLLKGAINTIRRCRPALAMSVYHYRSDLHNIMTYIHELDLGYTFYIRHHRPVYSDTVLYAVCK